MQAGLLERSAALLVAVSPGLPIAMLLLILGHRTFPRSVLLLAMVMGAFAALSTLGGLILTPLIAQVSDPVLRACVRAFISAATPEEAAKLFVLVSIVLGHEDAVEKRDAVLAGAWVGLGFALFENIFYVSASTSWATIGFFRALTAVPSHVASGLIMGLLLVRTQSYATAFAVPFALHGFYDWAVFAVDEHTHSTDAHLLAWGTLFADVLGAEWLIIRGPVCRAVISSVALPSEKRSLDWISAAWVSAALIVLLLLSSALVAIVGIKLASENVRLVALAAGAIMPLAFLDLLVRYQRLTSQIIEISTHR